MNKQELIQSVRNQVKAIAEEAKYVLQTVLESEKGVNDKVGVNTLVGSDLYNTIQVMVGEDVEIISLMVNDYIQYIESGRQPGSFPPPQVIANWCQRKGIPSDNGTVFLICRSIYENGIKPRPIFDGTGGAWEMIDSYFDDWADMIFNTITEQLDEYFND